MGLAEHRDCPRLKTRPDKSFREEDWPILAIVDHRQWTGSEQIASLHT